MALDQTILLTTIVPVVGFLLCYTLASILSFRKNKTIARQTGLPIISVCVGPMNPFLLMFGKRMMVILRYLPFNMERTLRFHAHGWEAAHRFQPHSDNGDAFIVVSPGGNSLYVCNAKAVSQILQRRNDFKRDVATMALLDVYGPNLATAQGADWQRHRKATAAAFTESTNEVVWRESLQQTDEMLRYWLRGSTIQPIRSTSEDSRTTALNVLAASMFSRRYRFQSLAEKQEIVRQESSQVYRDSLSRILINIIPLFIFGKEKLRHGWLLPKSWRLAGKAAQDFESYVSALIDEKRAHNADIPRTHDLVSNLVKACETEPYHQGKNSEEGTSHHGKTLTEQEIISNVFVYAFAGNDTTTVTLVHVLVNMAAYPDVQDWVCEEIRHYTSSADTQLADYSRFHKLKRCLAVMMETLRLCHPQSQLIKTTANQHLPLSMNGATYIIPKNTHVNVNLSAIHTHPCYWGDDAMSWNPKRHISIPDSSDVTIESEQILRDTTETYLPWAYGQQACPGKRFSQVEVVAVLARLFKDHVVKVHAEQGESQDQANARARKAALATEKKLLNEMQDPHSVGLVWKARDT